MVDVFIGEYSLAGIVITSVSPDEVQDDGGYELTILGLFKDADAVVVLVDADLVEYVCYSARSGHGYAPRPLSPTVLLAATPPMPPGVYSLRVTQGVDDDDLLDSLTVYRRFWKDRVTELRRLLPPWWRLGHRALDRQALLSTDLTAADFAIAAQVDTPFSLQLTTNNPRNVSVTWVSIGAALPGWLSLSASGLLTGTPTSEDVGDDPGLQFRASDGVQTADTNVAASQVT